MNKDRHKYFMFRILSDIFKDESLSKMLAFKGGTSLMFFHSLPRFSVDLDFNILDVSQKEKIYDKVRKIASGYGSIADEQMKYFGPIIVLDYGKGERNLKLEMSTRCYDNHYEIKNLGGTFVKVMAAPDMFAHKLCALLDRGEGITGRDVFDLHFFLSKGEYLHKGIVEQRMQKPLLSYLDECITTLREADNKALMQNVGELLDSSYKQKMRSGKLVEEAIEMLYAFQFSPLIAEYPESKMQIERVCAKKINQGESMLIAQIDGKTYADKALSPMDKAQLNHLPEEEDRNNFLCNLTRKYYYEDWKSASSPIQEQKNLKR